MGHLAIVSMDEENKCKILFDKVIQPKLERGEYVNVKTKYSGITWEQYNNDIPYDVAIEEIKDILRDAIVVGHDIIHDIKALDLTRSDFTSLVYCVCDTGKTHN